MVEAWTEITESTESTSIFQRLKSIRQNYLAKSPFEKWDFVRQIQIVLLKIFGLQIMDENFKAHFGTLLPFYLLFNYGGLLIYTLIYYRHDPLKALVSTPPLGLYAPCATLLAVMMNSSKRAQFRRLFHFGADYIYANSNQSSPKNYDICNAMAIHLITNTTKVITIVLTSFSLIISAPFYKTVFTDENEMIIPVILPFIDPETTNGFQINFTYQFISLLCGSLIIPMNEIFTCVLKNNVTVAAAVIENSLREFKIRLVKNRKFSKEFSPEFRNIIVKILDFDRYVVDFTELFYWKHFLQPMFLMYAISLSIFLYLKYNWMTGIGGSACCYIQLLIICDVGKTVTDGNDLILDAINRFPFYLLPIKKQKMYILIVDRMQNGAQLCMGPFAELNYETATDLTKRIYSILMFLLRAKD